MRNIEALPVFFFGHAELLVGHSGSLPSTQPTVA
jgi:hypothetical protein